MILIAEMPSEDTWINRLDVDFHKDTAKDLFDPMDEMSIHSKNPMHFKGCTMCWVVYYHP